MAPINSTSSLKSMIPGWGADLDPKNRPGVPRERTPPNGTGAHWIEPERQVPKVKIHISTEHHGQLTPVFGTSCPPRGLSGKIRDLAYVFSEGQKRHWLLLLLADRVNVVEALFEGLLRGHPDNPFTEMGLGSELRRGGFASRFGQHRSDVRRMRREALVLLGLGAAFLGSRALRGKGGAGTFRKAA